MVPGAKVRFWAKLVAVLCCWLTEVASMADARTDFRGREFIGVSRFSQFTRLRSEEVEIWVSPVYRSDIPWDELILSWNYQGGKADQLRFEARVLYPDHTTRWYCFGEWTFEPGDHLRQSIPGQKDADGEVDTDILRVHRPGGQVEIRILFPSGCTGSLKYLGLSFSQSSAKPEPLQPYKEAWGKTLSVPERTQADYPEGINEWCSPTSISMMLAYWAAKLNRPELDYSVPEIARGVNDPNWPGTGNWPFNTAFAGAHPGLRGYVTRLSDVSELEKWVEAGVPVAISVRYGLLKGSEKPGNGHLVVCLGFTMDGDVVVNDPGRRNVRQIYARRNLIRAWAQSKNTVYLIYPADYGIPTNLRGHW